MVAPADQDLLRRTLEHRAEQIEHEPELRKRLREIRDALKRLGTETYGFCEGCCLTIPWREILAMPERRKCSRCGPALEGTAD